MEHEEGERFLVAQDGRLVSNAAGDLKRFLVERPCLGVLPGDSPHEAEVVERLGEPGGVVLRTLDRQPFDVRAFRRRHVGLPVREAAQGR